jgi:hypothetical protein
MSVLTEKHTWLCDFHSSIAIFINVHANLDYDSVKILTNP